MVLEPDDAAEQVQEAAEDSAGETHAAERRFRTRAAIVLGVLAMLLALASLGGDNSSKEIVNANIRASDTFAFYQAKNIRQTANQLAADALRAELALAGTGVSEEARRTVQQLIDKYTATVARYESESDPTDPSNPLKGEGKTQLLAQARAFETKRDRAQEQDPNFDYATSLFQIAIVLGSVAIVSVSRRLLVFAVSLGAVAFLLMLNGFLLIRTLPFGD